MKKSKHTPGPWIISPNKTKYGSIVIFHHVYRDLRPVCRIPEDRPIEQIANARLIAKAWNIPEIVEAIKECIPDLEHYISTHGPGPDKRLERLNAVLTEINE